MAPSAFGSAALLFCQNDMDAAATPSRQQADRNLAKLATQMPMRTAVEHMARGEAGPAERIARQHLQHHANDIAALCLLGDVAARAGVLPEAERLFRAALAVAPLLTDAQLNLARVLSQRDAVPEAVTLLASVAGDMPERWDVDLYRLTLLGQIGRYEDAQRGFMALLHRHSDRTEIWLGYAHLQNTRGDLAGSVDAYRRALALDPDNTQAWWGLANLKVLRLTDQDTAEMQARLAALACKPSLTAPLHFALGKALEDQGEFKSAFDEYVAGNRQMQGLLRYDVTDIEREVERSQAFFSAERLASWSDKGEPSDAPIFIVGLPRSGSTLIEQILASHSDVEGTAELPYIPMLVYRLLAERWSERDLTFPDVLRDLTPERAAELGRNYLDAAAVHRQGGARHFIDKLPNNWSYVGFIHMILPNAKIIHARRSALACCWSCYRQWFARGQAFSYDFNDLAAYYQAYVRLIDHFDAALPGRIIRVQHEHLLEDPEREVGRLLERLELPFDEACLRFHENARPVRTASAQQVRRPIQRDAPEQWRKFEPWIDPLRRALGNLA
jgi:tetratricopeptide (TPR) repeat protein